MKKLFEHVYVDQDKLDKALKELGYGEKELLADIEGTCSGTRSYHFQIHPDGLMDQVFVVYKGKRIDITDWENA